MKSKKALKILIPIISVVLALTVCIGAVGVLAVGALAAGTLVTGAAVVGAIIYNQPEYVAARALSGFGDDLLARKEIKPLYQTLTGGSIDFRIDDVRLDANTEYEESLYMNLKGKVYFDEDAVMLKNFKLETDGLSLNGEMYISDNEMYISETDVLRDAYGVKLSQLGYDLSNSIFAAGSGSDYALDYDTYNELMDICKLVERSDEMKDDAEELSDKLSEDIWKIVIDYAEVSSESRDVRLNGNLKNSRIITVRVDKYAMDSIIWDTYYYLRDSEDIMSFLNKYEDSFEPMLDDMYDHGYNTVSEAYQDLMAEAEADIKDACVEMRTSDFDNVELKLTTPTLTSKLLKLEFWVNNSMLISLDCGEKGIKKTDTVTLLIPDTIEITYNVRQLTDSKTEATFTFDTYSNDNFRIFVNIDTYRGIYTAGFEYYSSSYEYLAPSENGDEYYYETVDYNEYTIFTVSGGINTVNDTTTITVDQIVTQVEKDYLTDYYDGYEDSEYTYTIKVMSQFVFDTKDEMPQKISYKTIADITEYDVDELLERLEQLEKDQINEEFYY